MASWDDTVKRRLNERLAQAEKNPSWLAREIHEHDTQVRRWLIGPGRVPASLIVAFREVIPTRLEWLLYGEGDADPSPEVPPSVKEETFDEMLDVMERARARMEGHPPAERLGMREVPPPNEQGEKGA